MKVNLIKKIYRYEPAAVAKMIERDCKEVLMYNVYMELSEADKEEVCELVSKFACSLDNLGVKGGFELYAKLALHSIRKEFTYFWRRLKPAERSKLLKEKDPVVLTLVKMLDNSLN